jgi:hypothetical protein
MREFCRIAPDLNRSEDSRESDLGLQLGTTMSQEFSFLDRAKTSRKPQSGYVFKDPGYVYEEPSWLSL